ncbi:hypothetical protein [Parasphingorhabdus sp.]|uniref:hypothetical protein n=1 Tax=Parasphingorhabdus sp. TaxID=2709688 RepID=UPI003D2E6E4D
MTEDFENIIGKIGGRDVPDVGPDFETGVWSRVSQIDRKRLSKGRNGLAAVMLVAALGAGVLSGGEVAMANSGSDFLSDGSDYSPASLLQVLP